MLINECHDCSFRCEGNGVYLSCTVNTMVTDDPCFTMISGMGNRNCLMICHSTLLVDIPHMVHRVYTCQMLTGRRPGISPKTAPPPRQKYLQTLAKETRQCKVQSNYMNMYIYMYTYANMYMYNITEKKMGFLRWDLQYIQYHADALQTELHVHVHVCGRPSLKSLKCKGVFSLFEINIRYVCSLTDQAVLSRQGF